MALASAARGGDRMTATEVQTPRTDKGQGDQRTGRLLPAAVAVGGLWLAMALSSVLAPDLISDAQDHMPIVAITIWIWGAVATGFVLFGPPSRPATGWRGGACPLPCWASGARWRW
jgi:hypothetical protein